MPHHLELLDEPTWTAQAAAHERRVDELTADRLSRAARGEKHPAEDFLSHYYSLRPAQLRRWHPGAGVVLLGTADGERARWRDHVVVRTEAGPGVTLHVDAWLARRRDAVRHVRDLLAATASRPIHLGCFALHEWAMVYRLAQDDVRHPAWPLRLGSAGSDRVVETHRIRCTHYDAFRFFAPQARPLNQVQPRREDQLDLEQPGCLHAIMDLYKWAYKLLPAVPSELVVDAFRLARQARVLDVRASPYDLRALGYEPVRVETAEGKAEFADEQQRLADRGALMRDRLLAICDDLLAAPSVARSDSSPPAPPVVAQ